MKTTARGIGCEGQHEVGCYLEFDFGRDFPEGIKGIYSIRFGEKAFFAIYFASFPGKQLWRRAPENLPGPSKKGKTTGNGGDCKLDESHGAASVAGMVNLP